MWKLVVRQGQTADSGRKSCDPLGGRSLRLPCHGVKTHKSVREAVDCSGYPIFGANQGVKGAFGAAQFDTLICSEATVAVAIDDAKRLPRL